MKRLVLVPVFALGLVACETTPPAYGPTTTTTTTTTPTAMGYSELRLEQNRYRVSYRGSARDSARVEDLALLRAAELTLAQGYDWFRIVDRQGEAKRSNGPTVSLGTGGASFGRSSSVGLGLGTSFNLGGPGTLAVILEVQMGRGERPNERDAYSAADVAQSIRARI